MPVALLILTATLPPLIEQTGKTVRKWLSRKHDQATQDELRKLRERVEALEREHRWK